jgi:hypothetical protein
MVTSQATKEAMWLCSFSNKVGFIQEENMTIFLDNKGCILLIQNLVHHSGTKHINIQHHYVQKMINTRAIKFEYISSVEMVEDMLTKGIPRSKHSWISKF